MLRRGLARAENRNRRSPEDATEARLDRQSLDFHRRVSEGYEKIAALEPQRFRMVDGQGDRATVAQRVWAEVSRVMTTK